MRYILYTLFAIVTSAAYSQEDSSLSLFRRSIMRNLEVPRLSACDSCYSSNTLLKMDINNQFQITSVKLSDNADPWFVEQFKRMIKFKGINLSSLQEYAKRKGIKNGSILLPMYVLAKYGTCNTGKVMYVLDNSYYQFDGKLLSANCFFLDLFGWEIPKPTR